MITTKSPSQLRPSIQLKGIDLIFLRGENILLGAFPPYFQKSTETILEKKESEMRELKELPGGRHCPTQNHTACFFQYYRGLEVLNSIYFLKTKGGYVSAGMGHIAPNLHLDTKPALSEEQAFQIVSDNLRRQGLKIHENFKRPYGRLVVLSAGSSWKQESFHLSYRFNIRIHADLIAIDVDAKTGILL